MKAEWKVEVNGVVKTIRISRMLTRDEVHSACRRVYNTAVRVIRRDGFVRV